MNSPSKHDRIKALCEEALKDDSLTATQKQMSKMKRSKSKGNSAETESEKKVFFHNQYSRPRKEDGPPSY